MKRVNNPSRYLKGIVNLNQEYYIGFGIKDLTTLAQSNPEIRQLLKGTKNAFVVSGKKGALKENIAGKYVRKQPESKISIWKHIEYYSTKWDKQIEYDREYNIWEKVKLHQFNMELSRARTPQGEIILHFPKFKMQDSAIHYFKAGAAMNMALLLSNYFLTYDLSFEPIIPVTKFQDRSILPPGMTGKSVKEKLAAIDTFLNLEKNVEATGNSYRFAVLKDYFPDDVTMGSGGFDEYLMFEYRAHNLLVLENLKTGNATYVFNLKKFNFKTELNKQNAFKNPAFIKRIIHENMEDWSRQMKKYFE